MIIAVEAKKYPSVLSALLGERVLEVKFKEGHFRLREQCDNYFAVWLTKEQLIGLADELYALADAAPVVR